VIVARAATWMLALLIVTPGCGDDWRLRHADETVRLSAAAITEIETSGAEDAQLLPLLERAHTRLSQIERSIELWRDHSGPLSYVTHAPCLRSALIALREQLVAEHRPVPTDLESADAMLADVASHECEP
jgi:hypothetical protein